MTENSIVWASYFTADKLLLYQVHQKRYHTHSPKRHIKDYVPLKAMRT